MINKKYSLTGNKSLIIVFGTIFIILALFIPKIFLRNNIYYISKDINKLYFQNISLTEENKFLKQQLEKMKYKNQIMDSLLLQSSQQ
ncbi:hypothetical protein MNB_ARC-1_1317 [hydrothermal vent metagenome]|uniref:Septum formation initiator n=1 Tax=hydrothermal vent metagenome TaxID=652676 RepID=A0A3B1DU51_9ZZZZ